jgi:capsular polysaccharide transport system permease protein
MSPRNPWQVTRSVWYALFIREALARITGDRFAAFWMLVEPIVFVILFVSVRELLGRIRYVAGADFVPWLFVGLMTFFLFREGMTRSIGAINANKALFLYRQVKPVDAIIVRCFLEGLLKTIVFALMVIGAALLGFESIPFAPLEAMFAWFSVWLLGVGIGLVLSVGANLIPEIGRIVKMISFPLLILSAVMFPIHLLPHQIQIYLLYNPILHGIESIRLGFFRGYATHSSVNIPYLYYWSITSIALGLVLHVSFSNRLKAK